MNIRPLTPEDYPTFAELRNLTLTESITPATLHKRDQLWDPAGMRHRLVAEVGGHVVGVAGAYHWPEMQEGGFFGTVDVDPASQRRGLGSRLLSELEAFVAECGGGKLVLGVRSDRPEAEAFLERRGYRPHQKLIESILDLHDLPAPRREVPFAISSYAEIGDEPAHRRRLFELHQATDANSPGAAFWGDGGWSFEDFEGEVFTGDQHDPRAMMVALDGGKWVGLSMLHRVDATSWGTFFTGVLPTHQGLGLGYETKRRALEVARADGARWVRAQNDVVNVAMLNINWKLGFQSVLEWRYLAKPVQPH